MNEDGINVGKVERFMAEAAHKINAAKKNKQYPQTDKPPRAIDGIMSGWRTHEMLDDGGCCQYNYNEDIKKSYSNNALEAGEVRIFHLICHY